MVDLLLDVPTADLYKSVRPAGVAAEKVLAVAKEISL